MNEHTVRRAQQGAAFRAEILDDAYVVAVGECVADLSDEVLGAYVATPFRHVTNNTFLPRILQEGLQPGTSVVTPDETAFFLEEYRQQQRRRYNPSDDRLVHKFIAGAQFDGQPRPIYLTGAPTFDVSQQANSYAIPESLKYFLRNLDYLSRLPAAEAASKERAAAIVAKYRQQLLGGTVVEASVLQVAPASPALARLVLSSIAELPAEYGDDDRIRGIEHFATDPMLELRHPVAPEHVIHEQNIATPTSRMNGFIFGTSAHLVFG